MLFMKHILVLFFIAIALLALPLPGQAYMTLFNDTGDWTLGIFGDQDQGGQEYRACKNSSDRNVSERGSGSLGILCISVTPATRQTALGLWHANDLGLQNKAVACSLSQNEKMPRWKSCRLNPTPFGKCQVDLSNSKNEIASLLERDRIRILLVRKANSEPLQTLEFEMDLPGLKKAAPQVYEFFKK